MVELDYSRFFVLGEGFTHDAVRVRPTSTLRAPWRLTRGEVRRRRPVRFERDEGSEAHDLVGTTHAALMLVSDRLIGTLGRFCGWTTYPVTIEGQPGYQGLAVTGRAGPVDDALSPRVMLLPPVPEGTAVPGRRGLLFQPDSWDGSDVFVLGDSTITVVTVAVRDALLAARLTNLGLDRLTEVERIWDA